MLTSDKILIKYLPDYLDYIDIEKGLSNQTQKNYATFLNKFFQWLRNNNLQNIKAIELTYELVYKYRVYLSRSVNSITKKNLQKSTQNYYLISLRSFLEFLQEKNIPSLSPTKIKLPKIAQKREVKFLNLEQLKNLLNAPKTNSKIGLRDKAILESLFSSGLRVSELINLNKEQFKIKSTTKDLEMPIIGKGEKIRSVYFSKRAVQALNNYLQNRKDQDKALFINYKPGAEKLKQNRRLTPRAIQQLIKKYLKICGLPIMITPHSLRHTFATDLLNNGVDLRIVQEFLGHSNIATTQIYTHVTNKRLRDIHRNIHKNYIGSA